MMRKYILQLIAVLAIGTGVMPSIYSMLMGGHAFYEQNTNNCLKCHSDIRNELDLSVNHASFTCEDCHVNPNLKGSMSTHGNVINPRCLDCHGNMPLFDNDSHKDLISSALSNSLMKGENEACISCHTTKSLDFTMNFADTYKLDASRKSGNEGWQVSDFSKITMVDNIDNSSIQVKGTVSQHIFPSLSEFECEKCHSRERDQLSSSFHDSFSCNMCHQLNPGFHSANIPSCRSCHIYNTNSGAGRSGAGSADAHAQFVSSADNLQIGEGNNVACPSCHSNFNKDITFTRPSYFEYDVVNSSSGNWLIENLDFGPMKNVEVTKTLDVNGGEAHNISLDGECVSCHDDIKDAVIAGGHSNEQWKGKHDYTKYSDMNLYCKSCHMPDTKNTGGDSPYPAFPFNSAVHGSMKISCIDCHGKSDLLVDINGNNKNPPYDSSVMGNIQDSLAQQPYFVQSYLCMACKNAGNPGIATNGSLHFKVYTEPQVTVNLVK